MIICYKKDPTQPNWKIALLKSMVVDTVEWFHQVMGHPGKKSLREMFNKPYHHPKLRYHIDKLKCKDYQSINYQAVVMVSYLNNRCGLHPGKKLPSI
jgi:hypothetical protein